MERWNAQWNPAHMKESILDVEEGTLQGKENGSKAASVVASKRNSNSSPSDETAVKSATPVPPAVDNRTLRNNAARLPVKLGVVVKDYKGTGVIVSQIYVGGPAHLAGVEVGDIITYANTSPTYNTATFCSITTQMNASQRLSLQVRKQDGRKVVCVCV